MDNNIKKWKLTCSIDGINIDYEEIIESNKEPNWWQCQENAEEHRCKLWSIELLRN